MMNRRSFLLRAMAGATGLAGLALAENKPAAALSAAKGFELQELEAMRATAAAFMNKHAVPGLSVAIAKAGRLVYAEGFGLADQESKEKVTPSHLFRIASVSKPLTSVAIFRLLESGKLKLSDTVFGPNGILGTTCGQPPYLPYLEEVTLEHLLTHTAGGWPNDGADPMFSHPVMDHQQLIAWTIADQALKHPPGEHYAYSNFGYCVLGRVIERLSGQTYEKYMGEQVLAPCGVTRMRISGNTRAERARGEVTYYDQESEAPYRMNVRRMDAHGGWLATPTDLVRFLVRVDGFPTRPDLLKPQTLKLMTTASSAEAGYAKGWCVNKYHNWWHMGSLPGTTSVMVRTAHQFCWAALTNTREPKSTLDADLDRLVWDMTGKITKWPEEDLF